MGTSHLALRQTDTLCPTVFATFLQSKETITSKMFNKKQFQPKNTRVTLWCFDCLVLTESLVIHGMKHSGDGMCSFRPYRVTYEVGIWGIYKNNRNTFLFFLQIRIFLSTLLLSIKEMSGKKKKINLKLDQQEAARPKTCKTWKEVLTPSQE